jgi:hypothetical protein
MTAFLMPIRSGFLYFIVTPGKAITILNKMQPGQFVFRLTVIDEGTTASSTVTKVIQYKFFS